MANLTVAIDDDLLRRARVRAVTEGTSVNAVVRDHLLAYATDNGPESAKRALLARAKASRASSGSSGRTWTRDDLYQR